MIMIVDILHSLSLSVNLEVFDLKYGHSKNINFHKFCNSPIASVY
jgi:hypothetical protein